MPSTQEFENKFTLDRWLEFFRPQIQDFADRAYARTHKDHLNEHEVIDDPEWEKIRVAAAELLKVLPC